MHLGETYLAEDLRREESDLLRRSGQERRGEHKGREGGVFVDQELGGAIIAGWWKAQAPRWRVAGFRQKTHIVVLAYLYLARLCTFANRGTRRPRS